jgi:hypothetical protein
VKTIRAGAIRDWRRCSQACGAPYDDAAIQRAFVQLNRLFINEAESIQLFVWRGGYAMSDRLRDYHPNVLSSFDDMQHVDIE